jgi:membrane protein DedA with SNARE-associated domain
VAEIFDWLTGLPPLALYLSLGIVAAVENIFPPVPADSVVALGAFLAARGEASPYLSFGATFVGNMSGVALTYWLGRRYGSAWIARRFFRGSDEHAAEQRLHDLHARYGFVALVASRFLPGFRAVVPPIAGALRLPALPSLLAMSIASAAWYGTLTWVGYRVGGDLETLAVRIREMNRVLGVAAVGLVAIILAVWLVRRRRRA